MLTRQLCIETETPIKMSHIF